MTDRASVRTGYDELGRIYADQRSVGETERSLLERALAPCPPTPRLLDAGCGPGPTLADLADRGRAVGLDFSLEQLHIASETAPRAALVRGDLATLPFESDSFDAAVSLARSCTSPTTSSRGPSRSSLGCSGPVADWW